MRLFYSCCSACIAPSGASLSLAIITELWLHPLMLMRGADKISDCAHGLWMETVCLSAYLPVISYRGSRFYPTGHALAAKQQTKMLKPSEKVGWQRMWCSSDQESPQRRRRRKMSQHCSFCDAKHDIQARGRLLAVALGYLWNWTTLSASYWSLVQLVPMDAWFTHHLSLSYLLTGTKSC